MRINSTSWAHYYVRFVLDDTIVSESWRESKDAAITNATNYVLTYHTVFEDLSIGTHVIKVQWPTASNLDVIYYDRRLSVLYQPEGSGGSSGGSTTASGISVNADNFNGILSGTDTTVQLALDTIDNHNHTLDSLSNITITDIEDGQSLVWDTDTNKWINTTISGGSGSNQASDISIVDAGEYFDSTTVEGALQELGSHNHNLSNLADVTITSLQDSQVLAWDSTTSKWINTTISGGSTPSTGDGSTILHYFTDGYLAVASGICTFIVPKAMTISGVYFACQYAGDSGSTIIDVIKNGTSIFTTQENRPELVYTENYASGTPDITELVAGDIINIDIPQIAEDAYGLSVSINLASEGSGVSGTSITIVDENEVEYTNVSRITISGATVSGSANDLHLNITPPPAGITFKEVDGSPSISDVITVIVDNGTLIDNGDGSITISGNYTAGDGISITGRVISATGTSSGGASILEVQIFS